MFKVIRKQTALLLVLTLLATTMATAQTVNMSKKITLTVQQGEQISLDLKAAAAGTGVKVVSGSTNQTITVGTSWMGNQNYTAGAGTMTVYGDIIAFDCSYNRAKLTALDASQNTTLTDLRCYNNQLTSLDVSQNTALKYLRCNGNSFTTQAFNDLMCSLPARTAADDAGFYPLWNASDAKYADFMAANSQIATAKNWQVLYVASGAEIPATTGTYTCPTVNMNKYITLTVTQGEQIRLDLMAAAANTGVKIVSGSTNQTITVGRLWTGFRNYTARAGTMTVYGDITGFDCSENGTKLTALDASHNTTLKYLRCYNNQLTSLDVSHNTALKYLCCYGNSFTTQAFNDLMCSLPARTAADDAGFYPLWNASDASHATFMAANSQIAKNKNWKVRYWEGNGEIPATTGTYVCGGGSGSVNMSKYITLTVRQGEQISLDLKAAAAGTGVKVVSGSTDTVVAVGTSWIDFQNYTAGATTMTVYGDITGFDCSGNGANLTALDLRQNTALTQLFCRDNQLTSLDVSRNTALTTLGCYDNQLTSLDVSRNTALKYLRCYGNSFTTQAFNNLMCSLPARTAADGAAFYPLENASDAAAATFTAANSQIATAKNWQVLYGADGAEIPATTGTYTCPVIGIAEVASVPLAVYPNPATDILTVETEATGAAITITDLTGRTVATATATATKTEIDISHLSEGTYIVRAGDRVGKVIKK